MASSNLLAGLGSALAFLAGLFTLAMNQVKTKLLINKITAYFSPYVQLTIPQYGAGSFQGSDFFVAIEAYLSDTCARRARKLKAELGIDKQKPQISVDDKQEIIDTYDGGVKLWWYADTEFPRNNVISHSPGDEKRRFYRVVFHSRFRDAVLDSYLPHILRKGRDAIAQNREHRLFTNTPSSSWGYRGDTCWDHVAFNHPATFHTLAMDPARKKDIIDDLQAFKDGKDYYAKVGKAWKRGYLLFGPPGTGKSTMVAAMANFLKYDVYDLELTAVRDNTELRKLFIETTGKSIIVIEDIDRSLGLATTKRRGGNKSGGDGESDNIATLLLKEDDKQADDGTKLTLSGLLNFIDGLWSACGGERIIIFTTNNKDKLDPALIRRGRMDQHIEMSYCGYEAFRVLANNYLQDINDHQLFELFDKIRQLLREVNMSPADVAGHLLSERRQPGACLNHLVEALSHAKDEAAANDKHNAKEQVVEIVHAKI